MRGIRAGQLEATIVPQWPLDVLAQQLVAETSCVERGEDELFKLVQGAWPYARLPRAEFDKIVELLSEGTSDRKGRSTAHLHRDGVNRKVKGRRHARLLSLMNGGTIPDHQVLNVISEGEGKLVGTLAEEFAVM